jgi:hypothetical protein
VVNLSRRFKLEYEDASNGTTIIAETGQDTGAAKINRHVHILRKNDPDILKLRLEIDDYGNNIPTDKSQYAQAQNGTDDPEILYKQFDRDTQSFVTQGRFYAKNSGAVNEDGELAVKLYSFLKFHAKGEVSVSETGDTLSAMNQALPSGYVAVDPTGGVSLTGEYNSNGRREQAFQELTRNYNYALTFTSELDANNDYKVRFEPVGQGGTVSTLVDRNQTGRFPIVDIDTVNDSFSVAGDKTGDLVVDQVIQVEGSTGNDGSFTVTSTSFNSSSNETVISVSENVSNSTADGSVIPGGSAKVKSWEKNKTDNVINKVTVTGVNKKTGNQVTATANNNSIQNKIGVKSRDNVKIGYLNASSDSDAESDAQEIAESLLRPGKGISELPESGRVKTPVFSDNIVNDSVQFVSNRLNIDDTFTVKEQRNFFPEGASELDLNFEKEGLEGAARQSQNLRDERSRLLSSSQQDVGNQTVDGNTENVSDQYDSHNAAQGDHDVEGQTFTETTDDTETNEGRATFGNVSPGGTISLEINTDFVSGETDVAFLYFQASVSKNASFSDGWDLKIENNDTGTTYFNESNFITGAATPTNGVVTASTLAITSEKLEGDEIDFEFTNQTGADSDVQVNAAVAQLSDFSINIPSDPDGAQPRSDGSTNTTNSSDSDAGDTSSLDTDGSTNQKDVNIPDEDKVNR